MVKRETFLTLLLCCCCGFQSSLLHIVNEFAVFIYLEKRVLIFNGIFRQSPHHIQKKKKKEEEASMKLVRVNCGFSV